MINSLAHKTAWLSSSIIWDVDNQFCRAAAAGATDRTTADFASSIQVLDQKNIVSGTKYLNYQK